MPHEFLTPRNRLLRFGAVALLGLVLAFGWGVWHIAKRDRESADWVTHTYEVILHLDSTLALLIDAETGQRGFVVTGRESYLEPYEPARTGIGPKLAELRKLTTDNPVQQANFLRLRELAERKMAVVAEIIWRRREQGLVAASALMQTDQGKQVMDDIRALVARMRAEEQGLLAVRQAGDAQISQLLHVFCGVLLFIAVALAATIYWLLRWIKRLQTGLVTMCAWTRELKYNGQWMSIEQYLMERFGLHITHGVSEKAAATMLKELDPSENKPR